MKTKSKRNYLKQTGITLIALVVTIVVLLILAGVSINALFGNSGIIEKAKDAQNKMDQATQNDLDAINGLNEWIDEQTNETTEENETVDISTIVGKITEKNTKAKDVYGNKITVPKGFKILEHNSTSNTGEVTYNYTNSEETGEHIPAVQDGIVIENETDGNQFVWVPVGTIKNKDNTKNTITLGRYSDFTMTNGEVSLGQPVQVASVENCTQAVTINEYYQELGTFREGNDKEDSTAENATARDLKTFIETTLANGGYYIARYEASGTTSQIESKYNQTVLINITQPDAAKAAREMYGEVKENNELIYASDLVNSYAWDTAIIFIQTYSTGEDASSYASQNKCTSFANTGINNDKYCNIWDMSGNVMEWTTENSTKLEAEKGYPCVVNGGYWNSYVGETGKKFENTLFCFYNSTKSNAIFLGLRPILYAK